MPHDSPPHTLPYTKGSSEHQNRRDLLPLQPHRTRSLTPQVHRTQLCGITTTISKSPSEKNNQEHQKNRILSATIDTPAAFYRLSLSASEQLFSNPVLSFLLFPELLRAKKAYSTSETRFSLHSCLKAYKHCAVSYVNIYLLIWHAIN